MPTTAYHTRPQDYLLPLSSPRPPTACSPILPTSPSRPRAPLLCGFLGGVPSFFPHLFVGFCGGCQGYFFFFFKFFFFFMTEDQLLAELSLISCLARPFLGLPGLGKRPGVLA
ncbi:hypothetical protein BR93DRAFT_721893 [Coniochaeta sp. PMI_546]|nr:hypothetical protein BR93DRAFT_721893 [Coniochaeta sp. PMI_546]